ncbi:MAG: hypothetical protein HZC42_09905 [Candidatus Eisenbacteria bacterium]|nr:hypothetical protein [Candidatus Eisenbacteria bacterium]
MSRTRRHLALAALLATVISAPPTHAQPLATQINGIGMLDFTSGRSEVRIGAWTRYHVSAKSELGVIDDYTVTMLIAGEENWWGEDGFWVETWTEMPDQPPRATATLMSYAIFDDSLAVPHLQLYMRKTISGLRENGTPDEQIYKRTAPSLKSREPVGGNIRWNVDTLGTDTVNTVKGAFPCRKVRIEQGTGATAQSRDSSLYTEVREVRTTWLTPQVPLTHIAREEIDYGAWRKTWLIGRSGESGPLRVMDHSLGTAELVDFGGGLVPRMVPERVRRTIAEQLAAGKSKPAAPAPKPAPAKPRATARKPG